MLLVIVGSVAAALVIAVLWDSLAFFFEPMFLLWGREHDWVARLTTN